jgi:hypothetical protein
MRNREMEDDGTRGVLGGHRLAVVEQASCVKCMAMNSAQSLLAMDSLRVLARLLGLLRLAVPIDFPMILQS